MLVFLMVFLCPYDKGLCERFFVCSFKSVDACGVEYSDVCSRFATAQELLSSTKDNAVCVLSTVMFKRYLKAGLLVCPRCSAPFRVGDLVMSHAGSPRRIYHVACWDGLFV